MFKCVFILLYVFLCMSLCSYMHVLVFVCIPIYVCACVCASVHSLFRKIETLNGIVRFPLGVKAAVDDKITEYSLQNKMVLRNGTHKSPTNRQEQFIANWEIGLLSRTEEKRNSQCTLTLSVLVCSC